MKTKIEHAKYWVGMDVAKNSFDAALLDTDAARPYKIIGLPVKTFPRTSQGVETFMGWLDKSLSPANSPTRVVMEATGRYSHELAHWLVEKRPVFAPAIINPQLSHAYIQSLGLRNKTDKLEARALAVYGAERLPAPYEEPALEYGPLRELVRYRDRLVAQCTAENNRGGEGATTALVRRMQAQRLRQLKRDIERIEKEICEHIDRHRKLKDDVTLLKTIYGIGPIVVATVLAEFGDLRRFARSRQLAAFAGLSPSNVESGTSVRKRPRMSKRGNHRVRRVLYLSATTAIRGDNVFSDTYRRLVAQGHSYMSALGAIMRKILLVMRAVLTTGKPFEKHYKSCGKLLAQDPIS